MNPGLPSLRSARPRKEIISCKIFSPAIHFILLEDGACIQGANAVSLGTQAKFTPENQNVISNENRELSTPLLNTKKVGSLTKMLKSTSAFKRYSNWVKSPILHLTAYLTGPLFTKKYGFSAD